MSSLKIFLQVLRRPGQASIIASNDIVSTGKSVKFTCRADDIGSPPAEYRWYTPQTDNGDGQKNMDLFIEQAALADNGEYRCVPYNKIGDGIAAVFLLKVPLLQSSFRSNF